MFDGYVLDDVNCELHGPDGTIPLEPQVFDLLAHLVARAGDLVTKEELLDEIWGDRFVSESALTSRLKLARRAVGDDGRSQRMIKTAHGRGYRFIADVSTAADEAPSPSPAAADRPPPPDGGVPAPALPPELAVDTGKPFVGRRLELERALSLVGDPDRDRAAAVWLLGEPGIGKTRLAAEVACRAHDDGAMVLYGRCDEDLAVPYQPFVEALRAYAEGVDDADLLAALGPLPAELVRLVPLLGSRLPALEPVVTADADTEQYRFFEAIVGWLATAAERCSLIVVLDDAHWAGPSTVQLVNHLLRSPAASRVVLVVTSRNTAPDANSRLDRLVEARTAAGCDLRLALGGLDAAEIGELVASPEDAERIRAETDGNPLLVEAVAEGDGETGGVPAAVERRLSRLPDSVRESLRLAAVAGLEFEVGVLAAAAGREELDLLDDLDTATAARLIDEVDLDTYRFEHALVRDSLRDALTASRRGRLHAAVADAVEAVHADDLDDHAAALVFHLSQAPPTAEVRDRIVAHALTAARRAADLFDFDDALAHQDRALERLEAGDDARAASIHIAKGDVQARAGRLVPALESFDRAFEHARRADEPALMIDAAVRYEDASWRPGLEGHAALEKLEAVEPLVAEDDPDTLVSVLAAIGRALAFTGRASEAADRLDEAEAVAQRSSDPGHMARVIAARINADLPDDGPEVGLARVEELQRLEGELDDLDVRLNARQIELRQLARLGRMDEFRARLGSFVGQAEETRSSFWRYAVRSNEAMLAFFDGDLDGAERLSESCLELAADQPGEDNEGMHGLRMFLIRREQDRLGHLLPLLPALEAENPASAIWQPGLAALYAAGGALDEAARLLDQLARDGFTDLPRDAIWSTVMAFLIEVATATGDRARAELLHEAAQPLAHGMVVAGHGIVSLGAGARYLAMTATTLGRWDEAEALLDAAAELNQRGGSALWAGHTRYRRAVLSVARGDRSEGIELAGDVRAMAQEHGFAALARMADELAGAAAEAD
jgi:DNA-binding winged helix-turn-helix (wHTH) protein/tetratricopeptide (TPR) repeat protein